MKLRVLFILSALVCFSAPRIASADEQAERPLLAKPFMKLSRGVVNMISAPLEIPNQMYILSEHAETNSRYGVETAAGAIEGLFTGIGIGLWRFVVGTYDVITFPVPVYEAGLIDPPYITVSYEAYYERPDAVVPAENDELSAGNGTDNQIPTSANGDNDTIPPSSSEEDTVPAPGVELE